MFRLSPLKAGLAGFAALALSFVHAAPASAGGQWVLVGQQPVAKNVDHDTFAVGWGNGRYDALRFRVLGNRVAVGQVRVFYGNGTSEHLNVREHLQPGQTTIAYDLKGEHRVITRIEMLYQTASYYGPPATMQVYGLRHDGNAGWPGGGGGGGYPGGGYPGSGFPGGGYPGGGYPGGGYPGGGTPAHGWQALGTHKVGLLVDHDTIHVGHFQGRFRALRLDVGARPIHLLSARVTFASGEVHEVNVDRWLAAHSSTGAYDLPGHRRVIERIDLVYRSKLTLAGGPATVTVYGLH